MSIEITGINEIIQKLNELEQKIGDLTPIMREIGNLLTNTTEESFDNQSSPFGVPWRPSARAMRQSGQTLVDRARLVDSFSYVADRKSVDFGTNVEYAIFHHKGTRKMPERRFMPISDSNELEAQTHREILELIDRHLIV